MSPWPDVPLVRAFLDRATRRLVWLAAGEGAVAGLLVALALTLLEPFHGSIEWTILGGVALTGAGAIVRAWYALRRRNHTAQRVERNAPECRNLLVTAAELIDRPARVRPWIGEIVCREAARLTMRLDPVALFPARRVIAALSATALLWTLAIVRVTAQPAGEADAPLAPDESAEITAIELTITPPAYTGRPEQSVRDAARIEALAGSRLGVLVRGRAAAVILETIDGRQVLEASATGEFHADIVLEADGYIAVEPATADGRAGARRLIGITVRPDQPPRVRVTTPGHDLFLPDADRTLEVEIEATDDLGLASLSLRYTKVSGSGEQFTFADGEIPIALTRRDDRTWTGRTALRLNTFSLVAGDVLVYRGMAADRRPGATPTESDAFVIEITAPGAVASDGYAMDDEQDRYALSQQMVILKTERLIARAAAMPADSLVREARGLAAEQRSVRAEFVFMMGGELADDVEEANLGDLNEEAHIEADDEAIAGRLENQGRFALIRAIRSMSRAYAALNETDLARALVDEKAALTHLQGAFSRTRYILRALTEREQIDLARRLTGELATASRDVRPTSEAATPARVTVLRRILAGIATLAGAGEASPGAAAEATLLAEQVLRADPSAALHQQVAGWLIDGATALRAGLRDEANRLLDLAATELTAIVRSDLPASPNAARSLDMDRLDGALTDALRRGVR
jgi:hypothetical protein